MTEESDKKEKQEKAILFEHNEIAYKKLCEDLKTKKCTTINHATGTGKSFIALKYLYNNRDKKFLYIAPTYPIINQLMNDCYKINIEPKELNCDTMIYRTLLNMDMKEIFEKYDGIIFDEYHRTGAQLTYKKIKELKELLEKYDGRKEFIGLTATPVRYLDDERNMTKEIFDGNVASSLPLADAMIDGLLPVPYYINTKITCRNQYYSILRRVERFPEGKCKDELKKRLAKTGKQIDNGIMDNKRIVKSYITEKDGKYIIFLNTIRELQKLYEEMPSWFPKGTDLKQYQVHSGQKRKKNQQQLNDFNESKSGLSLLFCVDVLNEGVHVDDIDGVIMLRRTKSPIIYFQQIGRALSFSGRKKQIKVLDLVNNFKHHNAINLVYEEYLEQLNKRIEQEPEREEEYEELKNRFKIKNETEEIIEQLEILSKEASYDNIYRERINESIEILQKEIKMQPRKSIFQNEKTKKAYLTISKLAKNVDNEQFKKLVKLDIVLPEELAMNEEERSKLLKGYSSIREKEKFVCNDLIFEIIEFVQNNGRNVKINSEDNHERELAMQYLYFLPKMEDYLLEIVDNTFFENSIQLTSYEKVLFDREIEQEDINDLICKGKRFIEENQPIPDYLLLAIKNVCYNYKLNDKLKLYELIEESKNIKQTQAEEKNKERYEKLKNAIEFLKENIELSFEELSKLNDYNLILELNERDYKYVKRKYQDLKKVYYKECIEIMIDTDLQQFCNFIKQINLNNFDEVKEKIDKEKGKYTILKEFSEFIRVNKHVPSINSEDESEIGLAEKIEKYKQEGIIHEGLLKIQEDRSQLILAPEDMVQEYAENQLSNIEIENLILEIIKFVLIHQRKPLINSTNEEEQKLAQKYEDIVMVKLNEQQIRNLTSIFNKKRNLRNACMEYIKNKGENR